MEPRTLAPSEPAARAATGISRGLAVPLHDQHDGPDRNACGTTSAAMVVDYYDGSAQQCHHSDLDALMRPFDLYSAPGRLADAVARRGMRTGLRVGAGADDLCGLIDRGVPSIVIIDPHVNGSKGNGLHYVVVTGYRNDARGQLAGVTLNDPASSEPYEMPWAEFDEKWRNLSLKGVPTTLDRVLISAVPMGDAPVTGADGVRRPASSIALPGEGGPGVTASGRPGLCVADGVVNAVSAAPRGNGLRAAGGVGQTVVGAAALPAASLGQASQRLGASFEQRAARRWEAGGWAGRAGAVLDYTEGAGLQAAGCVLETGANVAASAAQATGDALGWAGDKVERAGAWIGDTLGTWFYGR